MYGKDTNLSGRILFSIFSANGLKFEGVQPTERGCRADNFRWENMHLLIFDHQHMSVTPSAIKEQRIPLSVWTCSYSQVM